jgi:hypothetical protein
MQKRSRRLRSLVGTGQRTVTARVPILNDPGRGEGGEQRAFVVDPDGGAAAAAVVEEVEAQRALPSGGEGRVGGDQRGGHVGRAQRAACGQALHR